MKIKLRKLKKHLATKSICVAYDNQKMCDGAGAQIQRIAEIYGLSKLYNFEFSNAKINTIDSNPGDGINSISRKNLVVEEINLFLLSALGNCIHESHNDFSPKFMIIARKFKLIWFWSLLNKLIFLFKKNPRLMFCDMSFTKNIDPILYSFFRNDVLKSMQFQNWVTMDGASEIQLHYLGAKNSEKLLSERYIDYNKLHSLLDLLKKKFPEYKSMLHTDLDPQRSKWKIVGILDKNTREYWRNSGFLDENDSIKENKTDPRLLFPSELIDDILSNVSPVEVWKHMANAEILICGKSSLSFIGGLLNIKPNAKIIAPKGFLNYPSNWFLIDFDKKNPMEGIQFDFNSI